MEFDAWPKTPRLFKPAIYTEKIDGTNAAIIIEEHPYGDSATGRVPEGVVEVVFGPRKMDNGGKPACEYWVGAQSRKRIITPEDDNFGFANWTRENATELVHVLGEGRHFGEWWGHGIQRGYDMPKGERRFSLFNVKRWNDRDEYGEIMSAPAPELSKVPGLTTVPLLAKAEEFDTEHVRFVLNLLAAHGSQANEGFMRPEGVIAYLTASNQTYKAFIEGDEKS